MSGRRTTNVGLQGSREKSQTGKETLEDKGKQIEEIVEMVETDGQKEEKGNRLRGKKGR